MLPVVYSNSQISRDQTYPYHMMFHNTAIITTDASIKKVNHQKQCSATNIVRFSTNVGTIVNSETVYLNDDICQYWDINNLETYALLNGISSLLNRGDFLDIVCISDSVSALNCVVNYLMSSYIRLPIKFYWVKSHKYLVNDIADKITTDINLRRFALAKEETLIPEAEPFAEFSPNYGFVGGTLNAYPENKRGNYFSSLALK
ncbi:MAG: hypothetical protein JXR88_13705 [Clostridia bacterium]|nr:hypothetical protein [Clostridia bacterium]